MTQTQTIDRAITAMSESMKGFTPRFVARCLGLPVLLVSIRMHNMFAAGKLWRYEIKNGEYHYRTTNKKLHKELSTRHWKYD